MQEKRLLNGTQSTLAMLAPDYEYEETKVKVNVNGAIFKAQGNVEKKKGWKQIFSNDKATSGEEENKVSHLPVVKIGDEGKVKLSIEQKETKPPKPYTEGSLIAQMESIGKTVENEEDKKILKEAEGIGTSATRAGIIEKLKSDNYIVIDKKKVVVTDKGKILCSVIQGTLLASV
ncbi:DNA topoisomerase [Bacillus subtilis]